MPCEALHEVNIARRFYFASNGLIDYVVKIIDEAVSTYGLNETEPLGLRHLAAAFREAVWGEAPDELNPFCPNAILRPLMAPGEPFDQWDDPRQYTKKPRRQKKQGSGK